MNAGDGSAFTRRADADPSRATVRQDTAPSRSVDGTIKTFMRSRRQPALEVTSPRKQPAMRPVPIGLRVADLIGLVTDHVRRLLEHLLPRKERLRDILDVGDQATRARALKDQLARDPRLQASKRRRRPSLLASRMRDTIQVIRIALRARAERPDLRAHARELLTQPLVTEKTLRNIHPSQITAATTL
jgi:hypothetical protein